MAKNAEHPGQTVKPDLIGTVTWVGVGIEQVVSEPRQAISMMLEGIEDDRHTGWVKEAGVRERRYHVKREVIPNLRRVSAVSVEEFAEVSASLGIGVIDPGDMGANIQVCGIPAFSLLPPFTRLIFPSGAMVFVYKDNTPCMSPAKAIQRSQGLGSDQVREFRTATQQRRGIVGFPAYPGEICIGDTVRVVLPGREMPCKVQTKIEILNVEEMGMFVFLEGDYSHCHWVTMLKMARDVHEVSTALVHALIAGPNEGEDPERFEHELKRLMGYTSEAKRENMPRSWIQDVVISTCRRLENVTSGA